MPAPRHLRLTLTGTLPANEQFSVQLGLVPDQGVFLTVASGGFGAIARELLDDNQALFDDVVGDVQNFWESPGAGIMSWATVHRVKMAAIGDDGRYAAPPREAAVSFSGNVAGSPLPNQVARKVTLITDGDLGRVKGGFYLPSPAPGPYDGGAQLFSVASTDAVRTQVANFIEDLENSPGLDFDSFKVIVPSAGRRNKDGSLRVGPKNHDVTGVTVGRRADIVRRRANQIPEQYAVPADV